MKTLIALLSGAMVTCAASAAPTYAEARKLIDEMHSYVAQVNIWDKKPLAERIQAYRRTEAIVTTAARMFGDNPLGPFGQCWAAANSLKFFVISMNDLALILEGHKRVYSGVDLYSPMFISFGFGEEYRTCREQIEALDIPAKKPKT